MKTKTQLFQTDMGFAIQEEMLTLQEICARVVLDTAFVEPQNEETVCMIIANALAFPLPVEMDTRNRNTLRNLQSVEQIVKEATLLDKVCFYNNCGRVDLLDVALDSVSCPDELVALAIDLYEDGLDFLAEYIETSKNIDYNVIYSNHTLLYRIAQKEVFLKLVSKGLELDKRFADLLCFNYSFCRTYYYPYNQWILDTVAREHLQGHQIMVHYDEKRVAIVRNSTIETFPLPMYGVI